MHISIKYSKQKQFFFYAYQLSRWHYSACDEVADIYLKQTGVLTACEEKALRSIRSLLKKYAFCEKSPAIAYIDYPDSRTKRILTELIGDADTQKFTSSMLVLEPRFEKIWKNDALRLQTFAAEAEREIEILQNSSIFLHIKNLFGNLPPKLHIVLFVFPSAYKHIGGSANTSPGTVTVEISQKTDIKEALFVVLHELLHLLVRRQKIDFSVRKPILKKYKDAIPYFHEMTKEEALEELFLNFFLPDGYLSKFVYPRTKLNRFLQSISEEYHVCIKKHVKDGVTVSQELVDALKSEIT